jgi:hypothetical protein
VVDDVSASAGSRRPSVAQQLGARLAADVLHDDEVPPLGSSRPKSKTCTMFGCTRPRGGERLAAEARDELRVLGEVLGEQLDRDLALEPAVERELDGRHAAEARGARRARSARR